MDAGYKIGLLVDQDKKNPDEHNSGALAEKYGIETVRLDDINSHQSEEFLRSKNCDVFILGGYGQILKKNIIAIPKIICLNLHAGRLPEYRGSSPLNWVLINGEKEFTLSVIKVDNGVDSGPVVYETSHPIAANDTIADLHRIANEVFPGMLVEALRRVEQGRLQFREQKASEARYFPLRFLNDGFILFDQLTAEEIHNRIRALTEPYPCAFSFYQGKKVRLMSSKLRETPFFGEPGRIYRVTGEGILVCAKDQCLWIQKAVFEDDGNPLYDSVNRYDTLATLKGVALESFAK